MSAFLKFSQRRRSSVKERNPDMSNTDVSRLLGEMWRNASPAERAPYVEEEEKERAAYKAEIQKWRNEQASIDAATRTSHRDVVGDIADEAHASFSTHRQHRQEPDPAHHAFHDPANTYVSYEPIQLHHSANVANYPRDQHPREVFRSYSGGHQHHHHAHHHDATHSRCAAVDHHRSRAEAPNVYSYRFGGPFNHTDSAQYNVSNHHYQGTHRVGSGPRGCPFLCSHVPSYDFPQKT
jgi:hypothetical protein